MTELLQPIHQVVNLPPDRLPTASCWEKLSPHWPSPADRETGQWEAKVKLFHYLAKAWGAVSDDSYRALCSDLRLFFQWCRARELLALPARPGTIVAFIEDQAEIKAKASVRRYMASISKAHQYAGVANPLRHEDVVLAFDRLYKSDTSEPEQAAGLRWEHIRTALLAMGDRPIDIRDRALILVAYDCMLRCSEVPRLTLDGLSDGTQGYKLRVIRSKRRAKQGVIKYKFIDETTAHAVYRWCDMAGIDKGTIFRGVASDGTVLDAPLSKQGVNRAVQRVAKAAGLDPRDYSGQSCRIGACQDMAADGIDLGKIMLAGDWERPEMPAYYARKLAPDKGAMADLAKRQNRQAII
ncbi:hypothetical protein Tel_16790 (plasmid) [Candidatus Tenderia electrophaga]|uniref:Tyr recombinase domain-containing protein n=1 Tax=Candidatus Tenderia electrophaga TaxID=1748243 RepID=A0A0S2TIJ5_9GAMM|nr:hypothetical protein Tel_16790 [Candidatus Tenderia electrophaga]